MLCGLVSVCTHSAYMDFWKPFLGFWVLIVCSKAGFEYKMRLFPGLIPQKQFYFLRKVWSDKDISLFCGRIKKWDKK